MRILVKDDEHTIRLSLPTALIFSGLTAEIAAHSMRKHVKDPRVNLTSRQLRAIFAEIRRIKNRHGSWELVDVQSTGGEKVKIIL